MKHIAIVPGGKRWPLTGILFGCIVGAMALNILGCSNPSLKPWHTERLTAEFTTGKLDEIRTFDDYRQLEDRLFAQLEDKVYARTETGPEFELDRACPPGIPAERT